MLPLELPAPSLDTISRKRCTVFFGQTGQIDILAGRKRGAGAGGIFDMKCGVIPTRTGFSRSAAEPQERQALQLGADVHDFPDN